MSKKDIQDPYDKTVVDPLKIKQKIQKGASKRKYNIILTVLSGKEADFGKVFTFNQDKISIGRNKKNDLMLDDPRVSKMHCQINVIYSDVLEQIIIEDLDSTNGTYVNGSTVKQSILRPGDKIEIGETVLRFSYNDEIEEKYHSKLFTFASTDSLTGLYNKRYILTELDNQIKMVKRSQRLFSVVLLDIDDFKKINDSYGHLAGDEILKQVAYTIRHNLREQDIASRFGGEEFLILLPDTLLEGAYKLSNRIRQKIEEMELKFQKYSIKTTISAGISQFNPGTPKIESLIRSADIALYRAKKEGKNKVVGV
ncbi:MAG: diguanylate cyclase [Candidatus Aminicenantes bacterium]|nr:diguanylate cyclase [Candidatus Aminicenantes bacterium]